MTPLLGARGVVWKCVNGHLFQVRPISPRDQILLFQFSKFSLKLRKFEKNGGTTRTALGAVKLKTKEHSHQNSEGWLACYFVVMVERGCCCTTVNREEEGLYFYARRVGGG